MKFVCSGSFFFWELEKNNHISNVNNKILNPEVSAIRGKGYIETVIKHQIGVIVLR